MTFQELISTWNGKFCEVAGSAEAKNQCVDLANAYIRDVLSLPIIEWTNAKDFPSKAGNKYDWIINTPDGVPNEGDIVIWDERVGTNGHIAIFVKGDTNRFYSFDQNWPVGSPCKIVEHNWSCVSGWLRVKTSDTMTISKKQFEELISKLDKQDQQISALQEQIAGLKIESAKQLSEILLKTQDIEQLKSSKESLEGDLRIANGSVGVLMNDLKDATTKLNRQNLVLEEVKTIIFGKWHWIGSRGWKQNLSKLKNLLL